MQSKLVPYHGIIPFYCSNAADFGRLASFCAAPGLFLSGLKEDFERSLKELQVGWFCDMFKIREAKMIDGVCRSKYIFLGLIFWANNFKIFFPKREGHRHIYLSLFVKLQLQDVVVQSSLVSHFQSCCAF